MKGIENSRMNFIGRRWGVVTYRIMVFAMLGWLVLLSAIYGFILLREASLRGDVNLAKKELAMLNDEKDGQIKRVETLGRGRMSAMAKGDLKGVLLARPRWSDVLKSLARSLPPQVWLEAVGVTTEKDGVRRLNVTGRAKSQRALTSFIMQLESGGQFKRTELVRAGQTGDAERALEYKINTIPVMENF